MMCIKQS